MRALTGGRANESNAVETAAETRTYDTIKGRKI